MNQESEIDSILQHIKVTECGGDGLPKGGIINLVVPIKSELNAAQVITLNVRRGFLYQLVKREQDMYERELYEMGKAIWPSRC